MNAQEVLSVCKALEKTFMFPTGICPDSHENDTQVSDIYWVYIMKIKKGNGFHLQFKKIKHNV